MKTAKVSLMEKQGYRFVGKHHHSAIKICEWCRESLRGKRVCYKEQFYGSEDKVRSHRCIQMTPVAFHCTHNCEFCWRIGSFNNDVKGMEWDNPKEIVDEAITSYKEILQGFKGSNNTDKQKFKEAMHPLQFAISLTGEPTIYPYLPELVKEIRSRGFSVYVVSNGTNPEMIEKLAKGAQPTKMYITLPAPNEAVYEKVCHPINKNSWNQIMKSLSLLKKFSSSVVRLTLVKDLNMTEPEKYAEIINTARPGYVELKGFMSIGSARKRLPITRMPTHEQVKKFAEAIIDGIPEKNIYNIADENKISRVVLLRRA